MMGSSKKENHASSWMIVGFMTLVIVAAIAVITPQLTPRVTVRVGDGVYNARLAETPAQLERGLSGTKHLGTNDAMLFVFDRDAKWSIWMKDMNFPIDIIWIDNDKKVVHIVKNASPDNYPRERFTPNADARYVLEVPAGSVDERAINVNGTANFDLNQIKGLRL